MLKQSRIHRWIAVFLTLLLIMAVPFSSAAAEEKTGGSAVETEEKTSDIPCPDCGQVQTEKRLIQSFSELDEEIETQKVSVGTEMEELALPEQLEAADADANIFSVPVTWTAEPEYRKDEAGEYLFTPALPEDYELAEETELPDVLVCLEKEQEQETETEETVSLMSLNADGENETRAEGNVWTVTDLNSFNQAAEEIKSKRDTDGLTEATIVLTQDITFKAEGYTDSQHIGDNYFSGIENVTLTLTSDENGPHTIKRLGATYSHNQEGYLNFEGAESGSGSDARLLTGPMILDNIIWDTHEEDYIFAQGHRLVFTENFQNTEVISVVGGNLGTQYRQDGKGFEGNNEPGLTDSGELAAWKTDAEGADSTHLEIYGGNFAYVIAGGYNSDVKGDTYVKAALDPDNTKHHISNLFGGGKYNKGKGNRTTSSTVHGDTYVYADSGMFGDIFGGAENYATSKGDGVVQGDTHVVVGQHDGTSKACFYNAYGGSLGGVLGWRDYNDGWKWKGGNTHITIEKTAEGRLSYGGTVANVLGGGAKDTINGTTEVILNGGTQVHWVFAAGANDDYQKAAHILNQNQEECAARITVNGGEWEQIYFMVNTQAGTTDVQEIKGDVVVDFNGGKVNSFHMSSFMAHISGDSVLNIQGGTFGGQTPAILGYRFSDDKGNTEKTGKVDGRRIVNIANTETMTCWQMYAIDEINVNNTAPFIARGSTSEGALKSCGNVTIQKGTLALTGQNDLINMKDVTGKADVKGDFTIAKDGVLALNGTSQFITAPGCVNAAGHASGSGKLLVVAPKGDDWIFTDMILQTPKTGEVYLRSNTTDETAQENTRANLLELKNPELVLYVEYTKDTAAAGGYAHAWRIAKDDSVKTFTVTFDKNGGDTEANPGTKQVVVSGGAVSGLIDSLPTEPSKNGYTFEGWNTMKDGTGSAFTADTPVSQDITVYAQWKKEGEVIPDPAYKITYTDGVDDAEIFKDQVYENVKPGSKTPAFSGTPVREGYIFKGWSPEVAETVTQDSVYTAQWEKKTDDGGNGEKPSNPGGTGSDSGTDSESGSGSGSNSGSGSSSGSGTGSSSRPLNKTPKTGDETNVFLWMAVMLAAGGGLASVPVMKRKNKKL